jgi:hypothetical protein
VIKSIPAWSRRDPVEIVQVLVLVVSPVPKVQTGDLILWMIVMNRCLSCRDEWLALNHDGPGVIQHVVIA